MNIKPAPTSRASKRLHVEFPTSADANYALSVAGRDAFTAAYGMWISVHPRYSEILVISEGNRREASTVATKLRGLRAPAPVVAENVVQMRPRGEPATIRQREYLADLADRDPAAASDFGIGPLAGGIPAALTKERASRIIEELT